MNLLNRHILKELLTPLATSLLIFTFVFLMSRVLQLTELMVNKGLSLTDIAKLFIYATPYFLLFTIPMSVLFATVLTFIKLSADNEITAIKAAGVSLYQIMPPVAVVCIGGFLATLLVSTVLLPRSNEALRDHLFNMVSSRAEVVIKERLFIDDFDGLTMYIEKVDPRTKDLDRVFISDEREPNVKSVIFAQRGVLMRDPEARSLVLRLYDGAIDRHLAYSGVTQTIVFDTYDLKIDVGKIVAGRKTERHREEMSMGELLAKMKTLKKKGGLQYYLHFIVFHERLSVPFACIFLGLLGVPLGIQSRFRRTSSGLLLAVGAFLAYYLLYSAAKGLGETGLYPPLIGLWMPNILFGALSIYLLHRTVHEKPWAFFQVANELKWRLIRKLKGK